MRLILSALIAATFLLSGACKNELDILDNYHSELVLYGILNPADTVHYIRVSKVFIGEGNALVAAQNQDSIGFSPGTMQVKIEQWKNGVLQNTYLLTEDRTIPRDSGVFVYPYQVLFRSRFTVTQDGSTYKVIATDLTKGTSANAETAIVQNVSVIEPFSNSTPINLWDTTTIRFKWKSGVFGKRYKYTIRFHYTEQFIYDTTETSEHFLDWEIGQVDAPSIAGNETMILYQERENFLRTLSQRIPQNNYVRRIAGKMDFIFLGAGEELATYLDVQVANSNSSASLQPYSNINGGLGLFSARTTNVFSGYWLDANTRYQMRISTITQGLNFVR